MKTTRIGLLALACALSCLSVGRAQNQGSQRPTSTPPATLYTYDRSAFASDIDASKDGNRRTELLARRWEAIKLAVAHVHVVQDQSFFRTISYWQRGYLSTRKLTGSAEGDLTAPLILDGKNSILVKGDCLQKIASSGDALVHIYGDLNAEVSVTGQSEVVIAGDVKPNGSIRADGIVRVFVGGDVHGPISSLRSLTIWINGNLTSELSTGTPVTKVYVMGDAVGTIVPAQKAALLFIEVRGFAPWRLLSEAAQRNYTVFSATIGTSDRDPGMYPSGAGGMWVVHRRAKDDARSR
jgi:hypothetical protein